jgi:type II secretory ATPase GspE/PulE/Tfp pilus assembly ATPase PilB-like protein
MPVTSIPFSPVKLVLTILWVYLCFYCVQRIQFSPLISPNYKTVSLLVTLVTGPLFPFTLICIAAFQKSIQTGTSFLEALKLYTTDMVTSLSNLKLFSGKNTPEITLMDSSGRSIEEIYGHGNEKQNTHILSLTEEVVSDALDRRASDILIDPQSNSVYTLRLRIDGMLRTVGEFKAETARAIINSLKAIAGMDISERRRPQDGAFIARKEGSTASFRMASAGVVNGEKLTIRILNQYASSQTLDDTGFTRKQMETIREIISRPSGMILICGPTGSGKTTTLYAMLNEIDRFTRNVVTVEDPIETVLPNASQIEVNPKADITFAKALRSILRQDPDIICVGEIRDEETAEIGLRAAQTGHLVLATLHCDSNVAAIIRLLDLGVSPAVLASGLHLIISQRLMRCLCEHCKIPAEFTATQLQDLRMKKIDPRTLYSPAGCDQCDNTGYFGRTAVADLTVITQEFRLSMAKNETMLDDLKAIGNKMGRSNLKKQGLKKVVSGITTLSELKRTIG